MSKIDFKPPVGGTGVFSFVPPATNTDRTINLPDAGGQLHTSQSVNDHAAMPTVVGDPIVESGSNADGEWTRWADGTGRCTQRQGATFPTGSSSWSWVLPAVFSAGPQAFIQYFGGNTADVYAGLEGLDTTSAAGFVHNTSGSSKTGQLCIAAHGRWK